MIRNNENGEPWFVAVDVCKVLEIANAHDALTKLDKPGLYRLILTSRKPEAKAFTRWIVHDVLPAIHKTGSYSRFGRKDFPVNLTSRYGVKEAAIEAIITVFSSHLPLNDYADSQDDFSDSGHIIIMRAIDYVWGDACAYRALQIAMLRLIVTKHKAQDKSEFTPFMLSMAELPWNEAHI